MCHCVWILRLLDQKDEMQDQKSKDLLMWGALIKLEFNTLARTPGNEKTLC